jgi:hypothetical protein
VKFVGKSMARRKKEVQPELSTGQNIEKELELDQINKETKDHEQAEYSCEVSEDLSSQVNEFPQPNTLINSSVNVENSNIEYVESMSNQDNHTEVNMNEETLTSDTQEPTKLSLLTKYKELVFLVKDRNIDNVNTFRDVILEEYPDYSQEDVDDVWIAIATYATNIHKLYEKICNYYRIFVQKIVEDKQLSEKEKRIKIKNAVSGSPLASYVLRLANNEYEELYKQLYYELDGDINVVLKLLGV